MTMPENHDAPSGLPTAASAPKPGDSYVQSFARGLEVIRSFSAHWLSMAHCTKLLKLDMMTMLNDKKNQDLF